MSGEERRGALIWYRIPDERRDIEDQAKIRPFPMELGDKDAEVSAWKQCMPCRMRCTMQEVLVFTCVHYV